MPSTTNFFQGTGDYKGLVGSITGVLQFAVDCCAGTGSYDMTSALFPPPGELLTNDAREDRGA